MNDAGSAAWAALVDSASAPYARSGRFALHFARGKLRWDPVFRHLIAHGLIAPRARVLDIGCGQGLLASLLGAAAQHARRGDWPAAWAPAPVDAHVAGIDLVPADIARARASLGADADLRCADMRVAAFPTVDTVVMLDVLHYVSVAEQDDVLARVRIALAEGGRLLLRVGDSASRVRFAASHWVDRLVMLVRGRGTRVPTGRSLAQWRDCLAGLGFDVSSESMRRGTPYANVLFVATVPAAPAASAIARASVDNGASATDRPHVGGGAPTTARTHIDGGAPACR